MKAAQKLRTPRAGEKRGGQEKGEQVGKRQPPIRFALSLSKGATPLASRRTPFDKLGANGGGIQAHFFATTLVAAATWAGPPRRATVLSA